jgi:hypothetical protein
VTSAHAGRLHVTVHLLQQTTITFTAAQLWPLHGAYSRFGPDIDAFAEEVTRRLRADGYVGFRAADEAITVVPLAAVKRMDFTAEPE